MNIDGLYTVIRVDRGAPVWPNGLSTAGPASRVRALKINNTDSKIKYYSIYINYKLYH